MKSLKSLILIAIPMIVFTCANASTGSIEKMAKMKTQELIDETTIVANELNSEVYSYKINNHDAILPYEILVEPQPKLKASVKRLPKLKNKYHPWYLFEPIKLC